MKRRTFIQASAALAATRLQVLADAPMPMSKLGNTGLTISRYAVGGYHMAVQGEEEGIRIIHRAIDLGVTFMDSAALYHDGKSDEIYGKALAGGLRQKVTLMSKAEKYSKDEAMKQLELTLRRMKTDYLDLWQCHQVMEQKEVDQILGPKGSLEAFVQAKKEGKVRHIGFTGHRDPAVHKRMIESCTEWETVQMPINCIDPHYLSFITEIIPLARKRNMGIIGIKSNAMGAITKNNIAKIDECLRFCWSQDIDVQVSGAETVGQLENNVMVLKTMQKMTKQEISVMLHRTKQGKYGSKVEDYKKKENQAHARPLHRDGEPAYLDPNTN